MSTLPKLESYKLFYERIPTAKIAAELKENAKQKKKAKAPSRNILENVSVSSR